MFLTESAHDVVDAFYKRLGPPLNGHRDRLLNDPDHSVAELRTIILAVSIDQLLKVNPRYRRVLNTRDDGLVDQLYVHLDRRTAIGARLLDAN